MKVNRLHKNIFGLIILIFLSINTNAQDMTRVYGKVIDAKTKETLPFVNIYFIGKNIGTTTDYNGEYEIETQWASNTIAASYVGYADMKKKIVKGKSQRVDFYLKADNTLDEVVISVKEKYRNKNNPAVELIKKVLKHKDENRKEHLDYYQYDKHKKVEFDLSNITEKFRKKKIFKKLQFVFKYVDTAKINGKPYLPMFLEETLSTEYYRKNPKDKKEIVKAHKMTGFHDYINDQGVGFITDYLYTDIDLYNGNVMLLSNQFTSPISKIAPAVYKFHIIDTLDVNGRDCIQLAFQPRNKQDFAFKGNMYVTNDERYAVIKVDMRVSHDINLNFVNDLQIVQEFDYVDNKAWMITRDDIIIDFSFGKKRTGMFGRKKVTYKNYKLNQPIDKDLFKGAEQKEELAQATMRDNSYWNANRLSALTKQEENIYEMVKTVKTIPAFKRTMNLIMLVTVGYWNADKIDIGPVNSFYSFNDVEGFRFRLGGKTSDKFSKTTRIEAYGVYGFKDKRFKGSLKTAFSLNKRPLNRSPKHYISAMVQRETNFPGMEMQFINEDNFLLSFKRGEADKMIYYNMAKVEHVLDWGSGFSTHFALKYLVQEAGGNWQFAFDDHIMDNITSSEIITTLRFAPNEKYYEGVDYTTPIITKYPIFQLTYTQSLKGVLGSDYEYSKLKFNLFKRFYLGPVGFLNFETEAGKVFGKKVPYTNLFIHRANQTYSYQLRSYNLMNFLEFVSDEYVSLHLEHHFNGFLFNRIPLLKRLKWRGIISAKGIFGNLTDDNNPNATSGLMNFTTDVHGAQSTFVLGNEPYAEASVGIGNIFKFFRVDLVKRINYLDMPNVSEYGVRARFKLDF
jgi:hypothetical protein